MCDCEILEERLQRLEARMAHAERDLARLQQRTERVPRALWAMAAALALLVFVTLGAAPAAETRWPAPFYVRDSSNKIILGIGEDHAMGIYPAQNQEVPALLASAPREGHAFFKAQSADRNQVAVMGVVAGKTPEMELRSGGSTKVMVAAEAGKPSLEILNGKTPLLQLQQGERGMGRLQIEDASGKIMVQAGTTSNGVGAVSTFTQASPAGQFFRIPNSFICGVGCAQ